MFRDKEGGLLVDYISIATELKSALKEYTASQGQGQPTVDAHEAYSGFLTGGHKTLAGAANFVLGLDNGKKRFVDLALAMSRALSLCCTLDQAKVRSGHASPATWFRTRSSPTCSATRCSATRTGRSRRPR